MSLWYPHSYTHSAAPGFSSLFRMLDEFDKYAQQQVGASIGGKSGSTGNGGALQAFSPKFDVTEHDKEYQLQGELPGVPPENVVVEFTDSQTLVVRGHAEHKHTEGDPSLGQIEDGAENKKIEGGGKKSQVKGNGKVKESGDTGGEKPTPKYWLSERSYGDFSRVFSFPVAVDQDKVQAKFEHGILDVKVPKAESNKGTRRIPLQ
ncbi:30 kDa heat shock protein [Lasiosphaeria miniovina]|uniref:30 kDa heat shock protein n=1 Tax=Lasiosphaeria miniovina TaxID=1954250 RepID=A0AA40DXM5_9PEZI|nr:30 kDa heat shock protein [Lasiosphaeria miniovina]KAK0717427.1 30 kDa heat shock protein [Lasiosphaeria miniovina]